MLQTCTAMDHVVEQTTYKKTSLDLTSITQSHSKLPKIETE